MNELTICSDYLRLEYRQAIGTKSENPTYKQGLFPGKMADSQRGRTASRSSRNTTWDPRNPINWTVTKLHEELDRMGIYAPVSLGKVTLRKLYLENIERNRPARNGSERDAAHRVTDSSPPTTTTSVPEINTNTRTIANTVTSSAGAVGNELITSLVSSVHTMQQTMMGYNKAC